MTYLSQHEHLEELNAEISVKEYVAARKMREVQELIEELNQMKAERVPVAEYVRTHPPKKECEYGPCDRPVRSRGLCEGHYKQRQKGRPLTALKAKKRSKS